MKLPDPPFLLVTDRKQAARPLEEAVAAALAAGCRWVSLREKDLPADEQIALARRLLPVVKAHGATLTLHGDAALVLEAGLGGVHLGAGGDPAAARATLGPDRLIGVSIHTLEEARALDPTVIDYAVAGPAFLTLSKPGYGPALGASGIGGIAAAARSVPVIAIGGVDSDYLRALLEVGAAGVAVMGSVMRAGDPEAETSRLLAAIRDFGQRPR